jgi:hypothetical protein
MVTHSSTSRPVQCLCMAERTGCPVFIDLWSYVCGGLRSANKLLSRTATDCLRYTAMEAIRAIEAIPNGDLSSTPQLERAHLGNQQPAVHCDST